jgi:hypothetical protein
MIVLKLRGARQRMKAATGRCEGRHFYGQHPLRPEEALGLKRIRELHAEGKCPLAIAKGAKRRGYLERPSLTAALTVDGGEACNKIEVQLPAPVLLPMPT